MSWVRMNRYSLDACLVSLVEMSLLELMRRFENVITHFSRYCTFSPFLSQLNARDFYEFKMHVKHQVCV